MSGSLSSEDLLRFLREAAAAGRVHPATARSRNKAVQALIPHLTDEEKSDLRKLDLQRLRHRLADLKSDELRNEVIDLYIDRMAPALQDFFGYMETTAGVAVNRSSKQAPSASADSSASRAETLALEEVQLSFNHHRPDVVPVPLGHGRVVYLHGLPADLTSEEADRIARVVKAYADPEGRQP